MSKREYDIAQQTEEPQNGEVIFWVKGTESATDVINGVAPTINRVFDSTAGTIDTNKGVYCANNTRYNAALKYDMSGTAYPNKLLNASEILVETTIYPTYIQGSGTNQYTSIGMGTFTTTSNNGRPNNSIFYNNSSNSALTDRLGRLVNYNEFTTLYNKFTIVDGEYRSTECWSSVYETPSYFNYEYPLLSDFNEELWIFFKVWSGPGGFKGYLKEFKITIWND